MTAFCQGPFGRPFCGKKGAVLFGLGVVLLLCFLSMPLRAQSDSDLEALAQKAERLLSQEQSQPALRPARIAAFSEVVRVLAQRLPNIPSQSGEYPVALFRMGLYLYLSDQSADAQIILTECQQHPALHSQDATWNGKAISQHLSSFSGVRITARSDVTEAELAKHLPTPAGAAFVSVHGSKTGIPVPERMGRPDGDRTVDAPFTPSEKQNLRQRGIQSRDPQRAMILGKKLLEPLGQVVFAQKEKVVVLGIGEQKNAEGLADALSKEQVRLWRNLLGRKDAPPLVIVYANLSPEGRERQGILLSQAVHGRAAAGKEGYYSAYDRSLVLRKGIVDDAGKLYLGTAVHELVHALLDCDSPEIPLWLNEGLASLFEEQNADGKPIDNYRLYELLLAQKTNEGVSVKTLLDGQIPRSIETRDAMFRYTVLWVYTQKGFPGVQGLLKRVRERKGNDVGALCEVIGIPKVGLDKAFAAFLQTRDVKGVDERWEHIRPTALGRPTPRPSSPSSQQGMGGNGAIFHQIPQTGQAGSRPKMDPGQTVQSP